VRVVIECVYRRLRPTRFQCECLEKEDFLEMRQNNHRTEFLQSQSWCILRGSWTRFPISHACAHCVPYSPSIRTIQLVPRTVSEIACPFLHFWDPLGS